MPAEPSVIHELVVAMDYGQFLLAGGDTGLTDPMALASEAALGEGIAADGEAILVLSPHQNNFAMALRVEVWADRPPDDLDEWQEAFEATLNVDEAGQLRFSSPTMDPVACPVPAGRYDVWVTGRGIVTRGWPGSTEPGDSWRVRLWPGSPGIVARRLRSWDPDRRGQGPVPAAPTQAEPTAWTDRLRRELVADVPEAPCCRQAEAAAPIALSAGPTTTTPALEARVAARLRALLGDRAEGPDLMTELGLVSANGRADRGLTVGITARHCLVATWRGCVLAAAELVVRGRTLGLVVTTPTIERALALTAVCRGLGLESQVREEPAIRVVVRDGPQALQALAAADTLGAWIAHSAPDG